MGNFITIEAGVAKRLVLTNWRPQEKFKDPTTQAIKFGVSFDVLKDDGVAYDDSNKKDYTCTAVKALAQFKPIIEKAESAGKANICVSIVKAGEGPKTVYTIIEVPEA